MKKIRRRVQFLGLFTGASLALGFACAPAQDDGSSSGLGAGGGGSGAAAGADASSGAGAGGLGAGGATDPGIGGIGGLDPGAGGGPAPVLDGGGCAAESSRADQVVVTKEVVVEIPVTYREPFDMFIMYDQSGSMGDSTPAGSKWDAVKTALTGFLNDTSSDGIGVGIAYFPLAPPACTAAGPGCTCLFAGLCFSTGGGSCNPVDYSVPDVPIESLPGVRQKIIDSVGRHQPAGGTPTLPALTGAHQYAVTWAAQHPDRKTIVILATDGDPTGCTNNTVPEIATIAAAGLQQLPAVQTFVIGVGRSLTSLDAIAAAGGTQKALIVDAASGDPVAQFKAAMDAISNTVTKIETRIETRTEIQETEVPCEWVIPPPPAGQTFDKKKVNVDVSSGDAGLTRIGAVAAAAACSNVDDGWHYDDPIAPTKVLVCPQTCERVQAATGSQIDVVFGCATVDAEIK